MLSRNSRFIEPRGPIWEVLREKVAPRSRPEVSLLLSLMSELLWTGQVDYFRPDNGTRGSWVKLSLSDQEAWEKIVIIKGRPFVVSYVTEFYPERSGLVIGVISRNNYRPLFIMLGEIRNKTDLSGTVLPRVPVGKTGLLRDLLLLWRGIEISDTEWDAAVDVAAGEIARNGDVSLFLAHPDLIEKSQIAILLKLASRKEAGIDSLKNLLRRDRESCLVRRHFADIPGFASAC